MQRSDTSSISPVENTRDDEQTFSGWAQERFALYQKIEQQTQESIAHTLQLASDLTTQMENEAGRLLSRYQQEREMLQRQLDDLRREMGDVRVTMARERQEHAEHLADMRRQEKDALAKEREQALAAIEHEKELARQEQEHLLQEAHQERDKVVVETQQWNAKLTELRQSLQGLLQQGLLQPIDQSLPVPPSLEPAAAELPLTSPTDVPHREHPPEATDTLAEAVHSSDIPDTSSVPNVPEDTTQSKQGPSFSLDEEPSTDEPSTAFSVDSSETAAEQDESPPAEQDVGPSLDAPPPPLSPVEQAETHHAEAVEPAVGPAVEPAEPSNTKNRDNESGTSDADEMAEMGETAEAIGEESAIAKEDLKGAYWLIVEGVKSFILASELMDRFERNTSIEGVMLSQYEQNTLHLTIQHCHGGSLEEIVHEQFSDLHILDSDSTSLRVHFQG